MEDVRYMPSFVGMHAQMLIPFWLHFGTYYIFGMTYTGLVLAN